MSMLKLSKLYLFLFSLLILCISCGGSDKCEDEVLGKFSFQVFFPVGLASVQGGTTNESRISKVSERGNDILLLESKTSVTDGITIVADFSFLYDMVSKKVLEVEELTYGSDDRKTWESSALDIELLIDSLDYSMTNVSGTFTGTALNPDSTRYSFNFVLDEVPICFE